MNQGGTADSVVLYIFVRDSSLTDSCILSGIFLFFRFLVQDKNQVKFSLLRVGGEYHVINQTMASNDCTEIVKQLKTHNQHLFGGNDYEKRKNPLQNLSE